MDRFTKVLWGGTFFVFLTILAGVKMHYDSKINTLLTETSKSSELVYQLNNNFFEMANALKKEDYETASRTLDEHSAIVIDYTDSIINIYGRTD